MHDLRVFVSSTSEFRPERKAIRKCLADKYDVYLYEEARSEGNTPRKQLVIELDRAHVLLGILGARYGHVIEAEGRKQSVVEWEHMEARRRGLYTASYYLERLMQGEVEQGQREFLERLMNFDEGQWVEPYRSIEDLVEKCEQAVARFLGKFYVRRQQLEDEGPGPSGVRKLIPAFVSGAGILVALAAVGVLQVASGFVGGSILFFMALALQKLG